MPRRCRSRNVAGPVRSRFASSRLAIAALAGADRVRANAKSSAVGFIIRLSTTIFCCNRRCRAIPPIRRALRRREREERCLPIKRLRPGHSRRRRASARRRFTAARPASAPATPDLTPATRRANAWRRQSDQGTALAPPGETTFDAVPPEPPQVSSVPPTLPQPPAPVVYPAKAAARPGAVLPPPPDRAADQQSAGGGLSDDGGEPARRGPADSAAGGFSGLRQHAAARHAATCQLCRSERCRTARCRSPAAILTRRSASRPARF